MVVFSVWDSLASSCFAPTSAHVITWAPAHPPPVAPLRLCKDPVYQQGYLLRFQRDVKSREMLVNPAQILIQLLPAVCPFLMGRNEADGVYLGVGTVKLSVIINDASHLPYCRCQTAAMFSYSCYFCY